MHPEQSKVLIVDDENDTIFYFKSIFSIYKHIKVFTATSSQEALRIVESEYPKVIVTDLIMPNTNGVEYLKQIKSILPDVKVIVMTGWSGEDVKNEIESQVGVVDYLMKPIDFEKVVVRIISLLMVKN